MATATTNIRQVLEMEIKTRGDLGWFFYQAKGYGELADKHGQKMTVMLGHDVYLISCFADLQFARGDCFSRIDSLIASGGVWGRITFVS